MKLIIHNLTTASISAHLGGGLGFDEKPTPIPAKSNVTVTIPVARNPLACTGTCIRASSALELRAEPEGSTNHFRRISYSALGFRGRQFGWALVKEGRKEKARSEWRMFMSRVSGDCVRCEVLRWLRADTV